MVGLGRVELPTRSLGNCCSIHLSYRPRDGRLFDFISIGKNRVEDSRAPQMKASSGMKIVRD
jgi:hypothetical protein